MSTLNDLLREEDRRSAEMWALIDGLSREQLQMPGYQDEWSAKDLVAHLACWQARAVVDLEQMREGTYPGRPSETPAERLARLEVQNREYFETWAGQAWNDVLAEWWSSRGRLLDEISRVEGNPEAERRFHRAAIRHYGDHLPRLHEWVTELRSASA